MTKPWLILLTLLVTAVVFGCRWGGPSDLYDNDQPKTVAYTVDMVRNGRWLLPVDMLGRPATKPPMYNWIGAPAVAAGHHGEFALKLPSTLAALVMVVLTWIAGRWTAGLMMDPLRGGEIADVWRDGAFVCAVSALTCIAFLANYTVVKLIYTARPDMVLTMFLTAGWLCASVLLYKDAKPRAAWLLKLVLWLCVAGAALTKGPPALLLVTYVFLGGKLWGGKWSRSMRSGVVWGLPLALVLTGLWAWGAYRLDPEHFRTVFLRDETVGRIGRGGVLGIVLELWKMPWLFVSKFFPWSLFAVMGAWHVIQTRRRPQWFGGPVGPAMLWVLIVTVFFSLSGGKRSDYLAPAYPAAAVLAAFWLVCEGRRLLGLRAWQSALMGLVVALGIAAYEWTLSPAAVDGYGRHTLLFTQQIEKVTCDEPIRFAGAHYTPIQPLLGLNQPGQPDDPGAVWLVKPYDEPDAVVTSEAVWIGGRHTDTVMALYLVRDGTSSRQARPSEKASAQP